MPTLLLFSATVFVSAALLFVIQPLFAKMVLPLLGGAPSVWNTALVFYQLTLLAGYVYAHVTTRALGVRSQAALHLVVLLVPLCVLPIRIGSNWTPPTDADPVPWLLALLTGVVGLPFFAVSATAPLLQRWFSALRLPSSGDPYFLYAASNAGSFLALLCYPFVVEPLAPVTVQAEWWAAAYGAFLLLVAASAFRVIRAERPAAPEAPAPNPAVPSRDWLARRARWLLLAFIPSSLMVGVTTHVSMELAAVPLLWIAPLSLYLLSFVLVFARRPLPPRLFVRALPMVALAVVFTFAVKINEPVGFLVALHFLMLLVACMVCHGELARMRPPAEELTDFYLWMAVGGVLGGAFNALAAPLIFREITEYPVMIVAALLVAPLGRAREHASGACEAAGPVPRTERSTVLDRVGDVAFAAAVGALTAALATTFNGTDLDPRTRAVVAFGVPALVAFGSSRRALRFGLSIAGILFVAQYVPTLPGQLLHSERTFFGVHRVTVDSTGSFRQLLHGRVMHGRQSADPARKAEPIGYYGQAGPLGQVLISVARRPARIAVVGLGNGTAAAYGLPGEAWTFFEIDPAVERIARDRRWFTYLADSPASIAVVLGDGRRSLAAGTDLYDILLLDAYSSEAIPVHLLTREAMQLYLSRLAPHGMIVLHTTNRHFDLVPVIGALARDLGLAARVRFDDVVDVRALESGNTPSEWVVVARDVTDLGVLTTDPRRRQVARTGRVWTDDHSAILRALR